jgi:hypothetical protein
MKTSVLWALALHACLGLALNSKRTKHLRPVLERRDEQVLQPIVGSKGAEILGTKPHFFSRHLASTNPKLKSPKTMPSILKIGMDSKYHLQTLD